MNKNRLIRTLLIVIIGVSIGAFTTLYQISQEGKKSGSGSLVATKNFGGAFELINHLGEKVTDKDFEDQHRLIYFGFTYCPAICPTELQKISMVLNDLPEEISSQINPIFISVDPERDTVETIKNYISLFHPRMIGLTGTPEQVKQAADAYKVYYAKVQDETMQEYTVDHSSFIYFMTPGNTLQALFKIDDSTETIKTAILNYFGK
ncbi:MAG: SCO family protein [Pseudomonadota bacterium]